MVTRALHKVTRAEAVEHGDFGPLDIVFKQIADSFLSTDIFIEVF